MVVSVTSLKIPSDFVDPSAPHGRDWWGGKKHKSWYGIGDLYRLKKYIRGKFFDSPDGKKVVRQGLLYLFIKGLLATSTPAGSRTLNLASSDRSLYY